MGLNLEPHDTQHKNRRQFVPKVLSPPILALAFWPIAPDRCWSCGFNAGAEQIAVATTLLDEAKYPDAVIAGLFRLRWQVELNFRDIKTVLGLDVLRITAMIEKEIHLQAIAYNLVRLLMLEAARQHNVTPHTPVVRGHRQHPARVFSVVRDTDPRSRRTL